MLTTDNRKVPFDAAGGNILVTNAPGSDDRAHNITVGHTWVISPTMVNSLRVLGNDIDANKPGPQFFSPQDVGINAYTYVPGYVRLIVNGAFNVGSGSFTSNVYTKIKNGGVSDDFTVVRGSHQFKFGGHYLWTKSDSVANAWSVGGYTFTGTFTGNAMADFFAGRIGQHRQASENPVFVTQPVVGAFVQDTWKLNRVTLNYGVVWNPFLPMDFFEGDVYNFSRAAFDQGVRSTVMRNAPPGFSYPGDPGFEGHVRREAAPQRMGSARRPRLGRQRRRQHGGARRRRHGPRLHSAAAPPEHVVSLAVPSDGEPAAGREPGQPLGDVPGRQPVPDTVQSEQSDYPGVHLVPAAAAGPEADDAVLVGRERPAPDQRAVVRVGDVYGQQDRQPDPGGRAESRPQSRVRTVHAVRRHDRRPPRLSRVHRRWQP